MVINELSTLLQLQYSFGRVNGKLSDIITDAVLEVIHKSSEAIKNAFRLPDIDLPAVDMPTTDLSFLSSTFNFRDFNGILAIIVVVLFLLIAFLLLIRISRRIMPIYPITQWGFRAKLIYADDSGKKQIFRNNKYRLSVNPDLIYRLTNSRLAYIEYKSRNYVMDSDITQLEVGILALRGKYNVTRGAIALANGELHWVEGAADSSGKLYRRNKETISIAEKIKAGAWFKPVQKEKCKKCPMKSKCWK